MNDRLRTLITESGWTYEALAAAVRRIAAENGTVLRTNKSAVSHWVAGTRPAAPTAHYVAEALSRRTGRGVTTSDIGMGDQPEPWATDRLLSDDPVCAVQDLARSDGAGHLAVAAFSAAGLTLPAVYAHEPVARAMRVRSGTASAGAADIDVLRGVTEVFARADERLGGGHGVTAVTAYLADTAVPLLRARYASEVLRADAFSAGAELAYLAGWKAHDLGREGAAQRYYGLAFQLACEADPHAHAGWMLRVLAQQALSVGHATQCLALAEAALDRGGGHLDGQTEALLRITHARALAVHGDRRAALRALGAARREAGRTDMPQASWSRLAGPAAGAIASHRARAATVLGDHQGAELEHRRALRAWDPVGYPRVHLLTHVDLGDAIASQGRPDEAVATWAHAVDLQEGLASQRGSTALDGVRRRAVVLCRRGVPGAGDLVERMSVAGG